MKRVIILYLALILFIPSYANAFSLFSKKKVSPSQEENIKKDNESSSKQEGKGYQGTLPDIEAEFEYENDIINTPLKLSPEVNNDIDKKDLKSAPVNNPIYLDVIIKKETITPFFKDIADIIRVVEKLKESIEIDAPIQVFNAQAASLINQINYLQKEYHAKPESHYISYKMLLNLSITTHKLAVLGAEAQIYKRYLSYDNDGQIYKPENIKKEKNILLEQIIEILPILKAVR